MYVLYVCIVWYCMYDCMVLYVCRPMYCMYLCIVCMYVSMYVLCMYVLYIALYIVYCIVCIVCMCVCICVCVYVHVCRPMYPGKSSMGSYCTFSQEDLFVCFFFSSRMSKKRIASLLRRQMAALYVVEYLSGAVWTVLKQCRPNQCQREREPGLPQLYWIIWIWCESM